MPTTTGNGISILAHGLFVTDNSGVTCDYPSEADVKSGVSYGSGVYTGSYSVASFNVAAATDPLQYLMNQIDAKLREAKTDGELLDGNIPVKNIWKTLEFANVSRNQLPLIQYELRASTGGNYVSSGAQAVPFSVQFICWVDSGADKTGDLRRARNLRERLINSIHNRRPFELAGAARRIIAIAREDEEYRFKFAVGASVTISGDLYDIAGS